MADDLPDLGPPYNPTKDEVRIRIALINLMKKYGWNTSVMDEIMYNDNPTVETVIRLINEKGPIATHNILKRFIE